MITCDCCYAEFIPEPDVTYIGSRELLETGKEEQSCSVNTDLVCLCEKCYTKCKETK